MAYYCLEVKLIERTLFFYFGYYKGADAPVTRQGVTAAAAKYYLSAAASAKDSMSIERIKELKAYLMDSDSVLERFDGELFGRLIEMVMVTSLVEVTFIFKTGVEVREVLGE